MEMVIQEIIQDDKYTIICEIVCYCAKLQAGQVKLKHSRSFSRNMKSMRQKNITIMRHGVNSIVSYFLPPLLLQLL